MARWKIPPPCEEAAEQLAQAAGITVSAARILLSRGYTDGPVAKAFLRPSLDHLHDPQLLTDLPRAADRLHEAIQHKEKILLYGDYDVDGTMAVVILTSAIKVCGGASEFHVPHRLKEGYGMRPEVVEKAAADGVKLIVSVDTGIRAAEVVRHASTLGIDVIVTDHHLPESELPPAYAVVNPNRPGCGYPNKDLCGAGVAFKLAQALMLKQGWDQAKYRRMIESFLKLVALATVADVVQLTGENRAIVGLGLAGFAEVRNVGLKELLRVAGIENGKTPSARQVGFQIGPRINAAGRMESARMVVELFLTTDKDRAVAIADELDVLNRDRRETEKRILADILENVAEPPVGLVLAGEKWHRGVVGIVASRVVERFYRPTFVLEIDRENGIAAGSGRSIPAFHLLDALESMPELFEKFGGHSHAAGVTLPIEKLEEFQRRFVEYAASKLSENDLIREIVIDAVTSPAEITDRFIQDVFSFAPFGQGNSVPLLMLSGVKVESALPMGADGKHLKLRLERDGARVFAKAWNFTERAAEVAPGARIDAAITIEEDNYWGWSANLRDVRSAE